jgi:hypothetical protein
MVLSKEKRTMCVRCDRCRKESGFVVYGVCGDCVYLLIQTDRARGKDTLPDEIAHLKAEARNLHIEVDLMMKNFSGLGTDLFNALRSIERSLLAMYDEREAARAVTEAADS